MVDANKSRKEHLRVQIFSLHRCQRSDCSNFSGCCYELKAQKTHHKVDGKQQGEWAQGIVDKIPDVSVDMPPIEWIAKYTTGWNQTKMRSGRARKSGDSAIVETAPKVNQPDSQPTQPYAVHFHNALPSQPPIVQPQYDPFYQHQPAFNQPGYMPVPVPPYGYSQHMPRRQPPTRPRPTIQTPSSPIQAPESEDIMARFSDYLLQGETMPERRQALEAAIELINKELLTLEQLKSADTQDLFRQEGIKSGIAQSIPKKASEFKRVYKTQDQVSAAEGLMAFKTPDQP